MHEYVNNNIRGEKVCVKCGLIKADELVFSAVSYLPNYSDNSTLQREFIPYSVIGSQTKKLSRSDLIGFSSEKSLRHVVSNLNRLDPTAYRNITISRASVFFNQVGSEEVLALPRILIEDMIHLYSKMSHSHIIQGINLNGTLAGITSLVIHMSGAFRSLSQLAAILPEYFPNPFDTEFSVKDLQKSQKYVLKRLVRKKIIDYSIVNRFWNSKFLSKWANLGILYELDPETIEKYSRSLKTIFSSRLFLTKSISKYSVLALCLYYAKMPSHKNMSTELMKTIAKDIGIGRSTLESRKSDFSQFFPIEA